MKLLLFCNLDLLHFPFYDCLVNGVFLCREGEDESVARALALPRSTLNPGAHLMYLRKFELGRPTITQSFLSIGTSIALAGSGFGSHSSTWPAQEGASKRNVSCRLERG
jgi:hypothetical protein